MAAMWAMVVVAAVGSMYAYRQQSKAQNTQQDQWEAMREQDTERYNLAVKEWQKAVQESEKAYEEDLKLYEERREFYQDIAENPMDTEVWKVFERGIEQKYREGSEAMQHQLASRGGMVGGEAEEAFGELEMSRSRDLSQVLSGIIMRAEEQYQMEGARKPHWTRPQFLQDAGYDPVYPLDGAPPQLDLSGISSALYLLGQREQGTKDTDGTQSNRSSAMEFQDMTVDEAYGGTTRQPGTGATSRRI